MTKTFRYKSWLGRSFSMVPVNILGLGIVDALVDLGAYVSLFHVAR